MGERVYVEPRTLDESLNAIASLYDMAIVAGGTDLVVAARTHKTTLPKHIIAIHRLSELRGLSIAEEIRIGALVTHRDVETSQLILERYAALSDASALVGSPATRQIGTIGGNLCNGSPAAETTSPLLVHDASVELSSARMTRSLPLEEFLIGPGSTALAADELLTAVTVPQVAERSGSAYERLGYRRAMEIAVVGAAAFISLGGNGRITEARLALTAVAPQCIRVGAAEEYLGGVEPTVDMLAVASSLAAEAARPIDDVRAPSDYRRAMVEVVAQRALARAVARARENA